MTGPGMGPYSEHGPDHRDLPNCAWAAEQRERERAEKAAREQREREREQALAEERRRLEAELHRQYAEYALFARCDSTIDPWEKYPPPDLPLRLTEQFENLTLLERTAGSSIETRLGKLLATVGFVSTVDCFGRIMAGELPWYPLSRCDIYRRACAENPPWALGRLR